MCLLPFFCGVLAEVNTEFPNSVNCGRTDRRASGRTYGQADGWAGGQTGGWTDGRAGERTGGRMDGRADRQAGGQTSGRTVTSKLRPPLLRT